MSTWQTVLCACRSKKSGKFANKGKCKAFKRTKIRRAPRSKGGQFRLFD